MTMSINQECVTCLLLLDLSVDHMINAQLKLVSQPDSLCVGGEKTSGRSHILFVIYRNAIILHHINLLLWTKWRAFYFCYVFRC